MPVGASNSDTQSWKKGHLALRRASVNSGTNETANYLNSLRGKVKLAEKHIELLQETQKNLVEISDRFAHNQIGLENQIALLHRKGQIQEKRDFEMQNLFQKEIQKLKKQYAMLSSAAEPGNQGSGESTSAEASNSESMLQAEQTQWPDNKMTPSQKEDEALYKRLDELKANHAVNNTTSINNNLSPKTDLSWHEITISKRFIEMLISHLMRSDNLKQEVLSEINTIDSQITDRDFISAILKAHAADSHLDQELSLQQKDRVIAQIHLSLAQHTVEILNIKSDKIKTLQECQEPIAERLKQTLEEFGDILSYTHLPTENPNHARYQEIEEMDITELRCQFINLSRKSVLRESNSFREQQNELLEWIKKPFSAWGFSYNKYHLKCDIKDYRKFHNASDVAINEVLAQEILQSCKTRMEELYAKFICNPSYRSKFNKKLGDLIDEFFDKGYQSKITHTLAGVVVNCGCGGDYPRTNDKLKNLLRRLYDENEKYHSQFNYAKIIIKLRKIFNEIQTDQNIKFVIDSSNKLPQVTLEDNLAERFEQIRSKEKATFTDTQESEANFDSNTVKIRRNTI